MLSYSEKPCVLMREDFDFGGALCGKSTMSNSITVIDGSRWCYYCEVNLENMGLVIDKGKRWGKKLECDGEPAEPCRNTVRWLPAVLDMRGRRPTMGMTGPSQQTEQGCRSRSNRNIVSLIQKATQQQNEHTMHLLLFCV